MDAFGRMSCPGCGEFVPVVTHVDKPGSPDGITVVDIDLWPMAEHMASHDPGAPTDPQPALN